MFIVSANYRDRKSSKHWLVRDEKDQPKTATAFNSVVATNINFTTSDAYESGFGCAIVAKAETAVGSDAVGDAKSENEVSLRFCGHWFETTSGDKVKSCAQLRLNSDGSMYAVLKAADLKVEKKERVPA